MYKISGTLNDTATILVLKKNGNYSIEKENQFTPTSFEILELTSGTKAIIGISDDGTIIGYGDVESVTYDNGPYARGVFGGGNGPEGVSSVLEYISIATTGNTTDFGDLIMTGYGSNACSNGSNQRGLFSGAGANNIICYITINSIGNAADFGDTTFYREGGGSTSNNTNNRGVFGGGYYGGNSNVIDYVTISTTGNATDFGDILHTNASPGSSSNGTNNRGIFGYSTYIDYITITTPGNATSFGSLTISRGAPGSTSNLTNDRAVFAGGGTSINIIDYITISTTGNATDFGDMSSARNNMGATSNGTSSRGVFGGGINASSNEINVIEYITISTTGNVTDFGDLIGAKYHISAVSNA
jgi:hypothetical protein